MHTRDLVRHYFVIGTENAAFILQIVKYSVVETDVFKLLESNFVSFSFSRTLHDVDVTL